MVCIYFISSVCPSGFESIRSLVCLENSRHFLKTEANGDLVARVFPHFKQFACFYFAISVDRDVSSVLIGWCDYFALSNERRHLGLLKRISSLHSSL